MKGCLTRVETSTIFVTEKAANYFTSLKSTYCWALAHTERWKCHSTKADNSISLVSICIVAMMKMKSCKKVIMRNFNTAKIDSVWVESYLQLDFMVNNLGNMWYNPWLNVIQICCETWAYLWTPTEMTAYLAIWKDYSTYPQNNQSDPLVTYSPLTPLYPWYQLFPSCQLPISTVLNFMEQLQATRPPARIFSQRALHAPFQALGISFQPISWRGIWLLRYQALEP